MVLLNNDFSATVAGVASNDYDTRHGKLYAGNFTRYIVNEVAKNLDYEGGKYALINPERQAIHESQKVKRVQAFNLSTPSVLVTISARLNHLSGIYIYSNQRTGSGVFSEMLKKEMKALGEAYKLNVNRPTYSYEHEHSILDKVSCPSFIVYLGCLPLDGNTLINPRYHEDAANSITNTINQWLHYQKTIQAEYL